MCLLLDGDGILGAGAHRPLRVMLEFGCDCPVTLDLTEAPLVVDEERGGKRVAAAVAGPQAHVDGDLHRRRRGVNTSCSDLRCNVPDGHGTSGRAPGAR